MKIVSIINYKGGVGKTTVTANLAGQLAYLGKKILLIDMDAQASLTFSFITPDEWDKSFKDDKIGLIVSVKANLLSLLQILLLNQRKLMIC
jgi:cellulose biosynthesis protein BcsQ